MTESDYKREATIIRKRVKRRLDNPSKGAVTADLVWQWIKARCPTWSQQDQEAVFQRVSLS